MPSYRTLSVVPAYESPRYANSVDVTPLNDPGVILWGGALPPPALGSKILVTMNALGRGTVRAYFIEYRWLGMLVELHKPPKWWIEQLPERPLAHIFGIEWKPED